MRPPAAFGDAPALTVLPGGRRPSAEPVESFTDARDRVRQATELRRELAAAQTRERRAGDAVERARGKLEDAERRRAELRERLREAEAELRGAMLEAKRAAAALSRLESKPKR
jgi:chromosome segregation ATPase